MAVRLVEAHCNAAGNREKGRRRKWLRLPMAIMAQAPAARGVYLAHRRERAW